MDLFERNEYRCKLACRLSASRPDLAQRRRAFGESFHILIECEVLIAHIARDFPHDSLLGHSGKGAGDRGNRQARVIAQHGN